MTNISTARSRRITDGDRATLYAWDVLDGKILVGRKVALACERHFDDLARQSERGLHWHLEAAQHHWKFYRFLRHSKGRWANQPIDLAPWQAFITGSAFGWKRADDGLRRFRTVFQDVAKKNGKSTMCSGVALYGLVADREEGAEIYSAATKRDQARITFDEAVKMVHKSPELMARLKTFKLNISDQRTASKFEPLSSDAKSADGINPHFTIVDELHRHRSRALLDIMDDGSGAREQPLLWIITTSGDDDPESPYSTESDYAAKILERVLQDDTYFAYVATLDKDDAWDDASVWIKANPNLGISVTLDDLKRRCAKVASNPSLQPAFKRFRCNIVTSSFMRAVDMEQWAKCGIAPLDPNTPPDELRGRPCHMAVDLSSKLDISGSVKLFEPVEADERWRLLCKFWTPRESVAARAARDRAPYETWIAEGWLDATPGNSIDHGAIERSILGDPENDIAGDVDLYNVIRVAFDPWNAAQMISRLQEAGVNVVEFIQGFKSYTTPTKEFFNLLADAKFDHGHNPVLRWMASNMVIETDKNENKMPTKKRSRGRIDGMTALIMALGSAIAPSDERSYLETDHLIFL